MHLRHPPRIFITHIGWALTLLSEDMLSYAATCQTIGLNTGYFASYLTEKRSDRNHCVPILDVFQDPLEPDMALLVMPLLRRFNDPEFGTINEVMDFVRQSIDVNVPPGFVCYSSHVITGPTLSSRVSGSTPVGCMAIASRRILMRLI